jgi:hypothetical protein
MKQHWLYQWMDEEGIKTPGNYVKAIRKKGAFERLQELSDNAMEDSSFADTDDELTANSVIANRYLDLSGNLSCPCFECQTPAVNKVFSRAWHYFDSIVIAEEPLEEEFLSDDHANDLMEKVKLFLYLRNIDAEKHLLFTEKVRQLCNEHWREHAEQQDPGFEVLFDPALEKKP